MPYGTLEVVLVDAKDLHDTAFLTQEKTSTVAQGQGTNPEWNESFLFTVTDDVTELRLKIMDKDTFTADDFVGEATIPLEPQLFIEGSIPPTSYNVVSKHQKYRGKITIGLNFTPDPKQTCLPERLKSFLWVPKTSKKLGSSVTKMDPYVLLSLRTQEKKSTVLEGKGSEPEWNETFVFTVTSDDVTELNLKIMDKDTFSSDDFVGEANIPLEPVFMEGNLPPTSYSVVNEDKEYHGEITVGLTFTPERTSPRRKTMAAMGGAMVTLGGAMVTPGGRGYGDSGECYGEDTRRGYGHSREGYDDDDSRGGYGDSRGTRGGWKESSRCEEESYGGYKESSYRG
ncbi:hypothetical protein M0R45_034516 [Rubus argutus]|uniref:C2 domain-containing protein n=1 Tax=Rubus argutus TaxID=59490 RepID=A0AAW1VRN9_RUBAR